MCELRFRLLQLFAAVVWAVIFELVFMFFDVLRCEIPLLCFELWP